MCNTSKFGRFCSITKRALIIEILKFDFFVIFSLFFFLYVCVLSFICVVVICLSLSRYTLATRQNGPIRVEIT